MSYLEVDSKHLDNSLLTSQLTKGEILRIRIIKDLSGCHEDAFKILHVTRTILTSWSAGFGSWRPYRPVPPRFTRAMLIERYVAAEHWIICPRSHLSFAFTWAGFNVAPSSLGDQC
jgi:hypothetical protein